MKVQFILLLSILTIQYCNAYESEYQLLSDIEMRENETEHDEFEKEVSQVIKGYEGLIKKVEGNVENKKNKLMKRITSKKNQHTVKEQQLAALKVQIADKIKEVEMSQDNINKQHTSLFVYRDNLKQNEQEKNEKVRVSYDAELKKMINTINQQIKTSQEEQTTLINGLRKLYRQKKAIERSMYENEHERKLMKVKIDTTEEITRNHVSSMEKTIELMKVNDLRRRQLLYKLNEVKRSINETATLLNNTIETDNKAEMKETLLQLKKVRLNLSREIKNLRNMLLIRVTLFNKRNSLKKNYKQTSKRLSNKLRGLRKDEKVLTTKMKELAKQVQMKREAMNKQDVEVVQDIYRSDLSELQGQLSKVTNQVKKLQKQQKMIRKEMMKRKKEYESNMIKTKKEYEKNKIKALKLNVQIAINEKRRMERRIDRLERAMTDKKYTTEQAKLFGEKVILLRKRYNTAMEVAEKSEKILDDEVMKLRMNQNKNYNELKQTSLVLKQKVDDFESDIIALKQKISQSVNALEKSQLKEDMNDMMRRYAKAKAKFQKVNNKVVSIENKFIKQLKGDDRVEKELLQVLRNSRRRLVKRITALKQHPEFKDIMEEVQHSLEETEKNIEKHEKKEVIISTRIGEAIRKRDEELKLAIVEAKSRITKFKEAKEEVAKEMRSIMITSKKATVGELEANKRKMANMKNKLIQINFYQKNAVERLEQLEKVMERRAVDEKLLQASIKSKELIKKMKNSSRRVRGLRSKLINNKHEIDTLYKKVQERGNTVSEREEERLEQMRNRRAMLKNKLRVVMYQHKKLQGQLMNQVEAIRELSKYRIHDYHKEHAKILKERTSLLNHKVQIKKQKGAEYFYTNLDILEEKMSDILRSERIYKMKLNKRLNKMIDIAKEIEKKSGKDLEGIKMKCSMCRNLASFLLKKLRRDRMTPKQAMKSLYDKCEYSPYPAQCLRTGLKLSTKAFLPENTDLTPKQLCYAVGRCVLKM